MAKDFVNITERSSAHDNLENKFVKELLQGIHQEDLVAVTAVGKVLHQIEPLIHLIVSKLKNGGRLFYIGAGTSGRLGVLDASECPPTYGVSPNLVIGLIAGGDHALRNSIEKAEDDTGQCWKDLEKHQISDRDVVIGIAASGTTPYVVGGLHDAKKNNVITGCITCNLNSPLASHSDYPIEVVVGPEFVTGSSRMKAGTAQKLILNMISTSTMIQLGHVKGNKMVDMQLKNNKLHRRANRILMEELHVTESEADALLNQYKSIRQAIKAYNNS